MSLSFSSQGGLSCTRTFPLSGFVCNCAGIWDVQSTVRSGYCCWKLFPAVRYELREQGSASFHGISCQAPYVTQCLVNGLLTMMSPITIQWSPLVLQLSFDQAFHALNQIQNKIELLSQPIRIVHYGDEIFWLKISFIASFTVSCWILGVDVVELQVQADASMPASNNNVNYTIYSNF